MPRRDGGVRAGADGVSGAPRAAKRAEEALLTSWAFVYAKHVPKTLRNRAAFVWFVTGVVTVAAGASLRERRSAPLRSALAGVRRLRNDYQGSDFLVPRSNTA